LHGEPPERVTDLIVTPRAGYWGLWRRQPELQADAVSIVALRALPEVREPGWANQAMRFDQLPTEWRGRGIKIALIDTGVATGHKQLTKIERGFDCAGGDGRSWAQDPAGHGTLAAGIIAAAGAGIRGCAPDAELHVCKVGGEPATSDLVAALDYCIEQGI